MILCYLVQYRWKDGDWSAIDASSCVEVLTLDEVTGREAELHEAHPQIETRIIEVSIPDELLTFKVNGRVVNVAE
mgnify:FL=1